jgi:DNA-binding winged helix-turn-helix (wHTH) protein/TolB-like protein
MMNGQFRFGLFEFDVSRRELRREGVLIRLQPQPAQVLGCLLVKAGEVVSRDELREAVWGGETFVDFERGLNFCIAQIRSALGDDSASPRYVRTIPKRGYQFIAPVIAPVETVAGRTGAEAARSVQDSGRRRFPPFGVAVACALALLAVASYAGYLLTLRRATSQQPIVAVVRFDNETGDSGMMRFSDGLTDNLVGQLTTLGGKQYGVVGNAAILRLPRDRRNLRDIAEELHARYVVLGQVQGNGSQARILASLIRMPEQTHIWVSLMDRPTADPMGVELEAAQKIASEFSAAMIRDSSGTPLPAFRNR